MLSVSPAVVDKVVETVSPAYFDHCGDDIEKLTRATSEAVGHVLMEPPIIWTARHHSRRHEECIQINNKHNLGKTDQNNKV